MVSSRFSSNSKYQTLHIENIGDIEVRASRRARHLRLAISGRTGVYVVKPRGVSNRTIARFVKANEDWIQKHLAKMPEALRLRSGDRFSRVMTLQVTQSDQFPEINIDKSSNKLLLGIPVSENLESREVQNVLMKEVVKIWRSEAKTYLPKRLKLLAEKHDIAYRDVRVKYMHTRWGSCSSTNNINLNIQLMRLAPELIDHVILHELSHTIEHNHSKAFWDLFESLEPGARRTTKLLKTYQLF